MHIRVTQSGLASRLTILILTGGALIGPESTAAQKQPDSSAGETSWRKWSPAEVEKAVRGGKIAMVDFTAAYCTVCKSNKAIALDTPEVRERIRTLGVVAFQGDFTNGDADIHGALEKFGREGVPLSLLYPAGKPDSPIVLKPQLTKEYVLEKLDEAVRASAILVDDATGAANATRKPKLLFVLAGPDEPQRGALAECEQLTIHEYRKRGVELIEIRPEDISTWLEGEGRGWSAAHRNMQHLTFAKARNADAIGGLTTWEVSEEEAREWDNPDLHGVHFHGWGLFLGDCSENSVRTVEKSGSARAIPLRAWGNEISHWEIPLTIEPQACSASASTGLLDMGMAGQPFLGVSLDGNKITRVTPGAPAAEAGLQVGDLLTSFHDREIKELGTLSEAMADLKPGDEVSIRFEHDGATTTRKVKLADRGAVMAAQSPLGKPLPDLIGQDIGGHEVRLSDFRGKVVLLDFWATWCGPCVAETPLLQLTWERFKDKGLVWISVSVDDEEAAWRDFVKNNRLGGIQMRNRDWEAQLGVQGYPTIYLVDKNGTVQCQLRGDSIAAATAAMLNGR